MRAVQVRPEDPETRYLLAAVLGARSEVHTGRDKLHWAGLMQVQAKRVLEQSPEHGGARHLLGRLHAGILRMSGFKRFVARALFGNEVLEGASWESARAHLEAAEATAPCIPQHHFELARVYQDLGWSERALREARHALELSHLDPSYSAVGQKALTFITGDHRVEPGPRR